MAIFNKKIKLFVDGRNLVFERLTTQISKNDPVIWFHCASLGEFEQGRPIIEHFKSQYPDYKILVTFFSPSGYEVRKDYEYADIVTYLPIDTKRNAKKFIQLVNPRLVIFIKYEFWPNILKTLKSNHIETILVSALFREDQAFFKWYGGWMHQSLTAFSHFFVQNNRSKELLKRIGFENASVSGDTRFDRVFEITKQQNQIDFIENFIDKKPTLVAGSTWKKDEELLIEYINNHASENEKFIIAPHTINHSDIAHLKNTLTKKTLLFSDKTTKNSGDAQVLIIDSIGMLTKIYSYASVAYIGGGFGAGIHNILEPATFGVPIIIGPKYKKFNEAVELIQLNACIVVQDQSSFNDVFKKLVNDRNLRENTGAISKEYILKNKGATKKIFNYINEVLFVK